MASKPAKPAKQKKAAVVAEKVSTPKPKARSNQPRVTGGAKMDLYDYDMAIEVAGQKAFTPKEKETKKRALAQARAFESRFPKGASERTGGLTSAANNPPRKTKNI